MSTQLVLFDTADENGRTIRHRSRKAVTFKGGLGRLAHRWFRLTPSFSPDLVTTLLREFGSSKSHVLDPFSGRGTTPIECQIQNIKSTGIEINALLHFVGEVSLNWQLCPEEATMTQKHIVRGFKRDKTALEGAAANEVADKLNVGFPKIHNVFRWWREDTLRDLLILKANIHHNSRSGGIRDLFLLALANILLDAANITLGRLQLHFIDRADDEIDPLALYTDSANAVLRDLVELRALPTTNEAVIHLGDARFLAQSVRKQKFDLVITSPPYPNRYSYVWNTRPHLFFLDMFDNSRQAAELDCSTIGGTWGTATSRHMKGEFEYSHRVVEDVVGKVVSDVREQDLLMSNYVAMYFDDLYRHILELSKCLKKRAVCAYVVGNSRIKKRIVETDVLLSQLFQAAGFREMRLEQIRKRNSGKELHETIVIVESG